MPTFDHNPKLIEQFESLLAIDDDDPSREKAIGQAIEFAGEWVKKHPEDADAYHCLGLAWYHHPRSTSYRSWHCRRALEKALRLEKDHGFARHYLACLLFDQEHYDQALDLLLHSSQDYFVNRNQEWRAIKELEMILVCRMRLKPTDFPEDQFQRFVEWFHDAQKREDGDLDSGNWVYPQELEEQIDWFLASGAESIDPRVMRLSGFVADAKRLGFGATAGTTQKNGEQE